MRRAHWALGVLGAALTFASVAHADVDVVKTEDTTLRIGAMAQGLAVGQEVKDPFKDDERAYLFLHRARLRASGQHDRFGFNFELSLGGEDKIVAQTGVALGLLDLSFDLDFDDTGRSFVRVGQFKVPYGREELTYSGNLIFGERSLEHQAIIVGRDVGAAVVLHPQMVTLIGGIFTGGGRDVPSVHYLPEDLGLPMFVARVGVGNADEDPFFLTQSVRGVDRLQWSVNANGLYMKDSLIGHSSVLNVKLTDKSLLINSNWNPYIAAKPLSKGTWYQVGGDAMVRMPLGPLSAGAEVQGDYARFDNDLGKLAITSGRAQGSIAAGPLEAALRYSVIWPDPKFASGGVAITGKDMIQEITPAVSFNAYGNRLKVIADLPITVNAPVIIEDKVGAYVATQLPDQTALLGKTGTVEKQNVVEGRLLVQGWF